MRADAGASKEKRPEFRGLAKRKKKRGRATKGSYANLAARARFPTRMRRFPVEGLAAWRPASRNARF